MEHNWNEIVVITDVKWRKSLSAIRSIGKNNNFIIAIGNSLFDMGLWSSYVNKRVIIPNIWRNQEKYKNRLIYILEQAYTKFKKRPILLAMEDDTLKLLIQNKSIMRKCKCLIPNIKSYIIANNKFTAVQIAKKLGIDIPYTKRFKALDDLLLYLEINSKRNWVVKPEVGKGSFGVTYVSTKHDLGVIKKHWRRYGRLIVQERIPLEGESICVAMIFSNTHKLSNYFVYKRLRTYPVRGGPSTSRIGIYNTYLVSQSYCIMKALKWTGVVMLEWKKDIRDNLYKLIEINPRFWGGLELGIKSGVNFPQNYIDLSCNRELTLHSNYRRDILSRWIVPGDILWLLSKKHKTLGDIREFFYNILSDSDEWDRTDIQGSIATIFCQFVQSLNPSNWRFLRR